MLVAAATLAAPRGASSAPEPPWTPEGPADCQHYVAEYNALTPQIEAAAAARDTAKKNDLTKERSARKRAFQNCVQGYSQMKPLGPAKLDPREQPAQTPSPTWTDAHGDTRTMSNRFVYTTPEGPAYRVPEDDRFRRAALLPGREEHPLQGQRRRTVERRGGLPERGG
jgi:hypothetical protein